jgi:hypothetical protein
VTETNREQRRARVAELAAAGMTVAQICRETNLSRDVVKRDLLHGGPVERTQAQLTEYVNARYTLSGKHWMWDGLTTPRGLPIIRSSVTVAASRHAWLMHYGSAPTGRLVRTCDEALCIAPLHHEDQVMRTRVRRSLRAITRVAAPPTMCAAGHDQEQHGRFYPDGRQYCHPCKTHRSAVRAGQLAPRSASGTNGGAVEGAR